MLNVIANIAFSLDDNNNACSGFCQASLIATYQLKIKYLSFLWLTNEFSKKLVDYQFIKMLRDGASRRCYHAI